VNSYQPTRTALGLALATLIGPGALIGQTAYSAAHAQSSLTPLQDGFFSLDFTEAKVGLTFVKNHVAECPDDSCVPRGLVFSMHTSFAARKGIQDLFSSFDFTPGYDFGGRLAYASPHHDWYHTVFLGVTYAVNDRRTIMFDTVAQTGTLDDVHQKTIAVTVGFNHAFSAVTILGLAIEGRRELSTPGVALAREYCTPGTATNGLRVNVCSDRYLAPLGNLWTGQIRTDLSVGLGKLGPPDTPARLGLTSALSLDLVEHARAALNVATGPSIHLARYPGQPVAVLLFGLQDMLDAYDLRADDPNPPAYLVDHFAVRLVISAPFALLMGSRS
jgi:hypothetical protein